MNLLPTLKSNLRFPFLPFFLVKWLPVLLLGSLVLRAETDLPFRNPELPVEERVNDLLSRLTIDEKIGQTMMDSPEISRLGIARYDWWNEALHGVARNGFATVFPQAIGLAATWNPALHEKIAEVISTEARAKYAEAIVKNGGFPKRYQGLTIWSPNINIFRDPRWGRGQETYGEDPFLTARMGVAFVQGLQGNDPRYLKTVATVKHYAVHSGPEKLRHQFDAVVSDRDLRETYLPAFESCIREGGSASIMSAYNAINGVPAPAHELLLQKILRGEWGFNGAVVGDVDNVADMWRKDGHLYSKTAEEASAKAIRIGNDLCSGKTYGALGAALKNGLVTEDDINVALRRLFTLRFRLGEFDPASRVPFSSILPTAYNTPENDRMALEAARQSLVMLKNDGALPWNPKLLKTVAVIGPTGADKAALLGNYCGVPSRTVTLVDGIRAKFESMGIKVLAEPGSALAKGFRVKAKPFPAGTLFTDANCTQKGFVGEVSKGGKKPEARMDEQIDLQWSEAQPIEGIPLKNAGLKWAGVLVPPVSGEYLFDVIFEGKIKITLDSKELISSWIKPAADRARQHLNATVSLEKGKAYPVNVEYEQTLDSGGFIQLGWLIPGQDDLLEKAIGAAKQADHIVLTLGITPSLEGEEMKVSAEGFAGGDRTSIDLPASQVALLEKVAALEKPTVVVLTTGSAINLDDTRVNGVLLAWYYGQRGAEAVAETLLGEYNPAGRLPITFYRDINDQLPFTDYSMVNRTYRYYTGKPLYAFGHGLSYTTFDYGEMKSSEAAPKSDSVVNVTVPITNNGKIAGDEVVQIYARAINPPVVMPQQWLVGFSRVSMQPGETKSIVIPVKMSSLRRWDETKKSYTVDPGSYELIAASASDQPKRRVALLVSVP